MTTVDRINRRLDKEKADREEALSKNASKREERYQKIEALFAEYDDLCRREPYTIPEDARRLYAHILDEYGHDLLWFFLRVREGKMP
jgi:hypothetical protein